MDKYVEAEKRLAELLGWADVHWDEEVSHLIGILPKEPKPKDGARWFVPSWCRRNDGLLTLAVEHCLMLDIAGMEVDVGYGIQKPQDWLSTQYADHPSKEVAVRFTIVQAVIAKLEAAQ
jgi:hypothetical protein